MQKIERNLAEGSVARQLILFSIPFVLSSIVQNLYGLVDMIVIGQYAGTISLAGVNTSSAYVSLITNIAIGFCNGGAVIIGQYQGRGDRDKLKKVIGTLCAFLLLLAVCLSAASAGTCRGILRIMQTPGEAYAEARGYLLVSAIGFVFIFGYNLLSAILRGMGDSRHPFLFICVACCINVVLDVVLIGGFGMGAAGAALATVAAQGVSLLLCVLFLRRNDFVFDFRLRSIRLESESLRLLLRVAVPTTVQNSITVFGYTVISAISNVLGVTVSAAMGGAHKITLFAILPSVAFGNAIAAMCAQNFGAGRRDRALSTMRVGFALTMCVNLALFLLIELLPGPLMRMFGNDGDMVAQGVRYLRICSLDYLFVPFYGSLTGYLIGSGHTVRPAILGLCSSFLFRVPGAYVLGVLLGGGIAGIAWGTPAASFFVGLYCLLYYLSGRCDCIEQIAKL